MNMNVKFPLGKIVATPGAIELLDKNGLNGSSILSRHLQGDWGDICEEDAEQNNVSVDGKQRLLSSYDLPEDKKVWIITEWDRSVTTILLPSEY